VLGDVSQGEVLVGEETVAVTAGARHTTEYCSVDALARPTRGAGSPHDPDRRILEEMSTPPGARRRHLASSPFKPDPVPTIEDYAVGDLVSHDSYGMGRVVGTDAGAVTVDFRDRTVRVTSPFAKMSKL
jgi:hypothetical protein